MRVTNLTLVALMLTLSIGGQKPSDQSQTRSGMTGADPQRSRSFDLPPMLQPSGLAWRTTPLFTTVKTYHSTVQSYFGSAMGGSIGFSSMSSGHGLSEMVLAGNTIFFSIYINDGYIYAQDAATGKDKWRFKEVNSRFTSVAVGKDAVFFSSNDGTIYALNADTGEVIWRKKKKTQFGWLPTSPLIVDGVVYFATAEEATGGRTYGTGHVFAFEAAAGKELWTADFEGDVTAPALADGLLFVGTSTGNLRAIDSKSGVEKWHIDVSDVYWVWNPIVVDGSVITTTGAGTVRSVEAKTGKEQWKSSSLEAPGTLFAAYDGMFFYGGVNKNLYAVSATTGKPIWELKTSGECRSPVISRGILYAACGDALLAASALSGTGGWKMDKLIAPLSTPLPADGALYFIDGGARLYSLK